MVSPPRARMNSTPICWLSSRGDGARKSVGGANRRNSDAGRGPFAQDLAAEAEEFGGAASGEAFDLTGRLDKAAGHHEAAKVLFVQTDAGQRLHHLLEAEQGEGRRKQLKHQRAVFQLTTEAAESRRQEPPVIRRHRLTERLWRLR